MSLFSRRFSIDPEKKIRPLFLSIRHNYFIALISLLRVYGYLQPAVFFYMISIKLGEADKKKKKPSFSTPVVLISGLRYIRTLPTLKKNK